MIRRNPDGCFTAALYRALRNLDYWGSLGCFRIHKPCPDRVLDTVHPLRTGGTSLQFRGVKQMEETTEIQKTEQLPAEKPAEKPKKKKLSKKKIALIVVAALILVPLGSCVYGTLTYKPTLNGAAASMGEIRTTVSFSANVAGDGLEKYPIPETTEVEKVYFEVGDSVKAGDLIVKFDNSDAVDAYKKATINYETARLQLNETEKDYWDLKEDLDECIEDIEFYKESGRITRTTKSSIRMRMKMKSKPTGSTTTTTTSGKPPRPRRRAWKSRFPRQTTSRSSSSTLS